MARKTVAKPGINASSAVRQDDVAPRAVPKELTDGGLGDGGLADGGLTEFVEFTPAPRSEDRGSKPVLTEDATFDFAGLAAATGKGPGTLPAANAARAEHSQSFVWQMDYPEHPALQNAADHAVEILRQTRETLAERFFLDEAPVSDPVTVDVEAAFGKPVSGGGGGGGGGGKGKTKTVTDPVVDDSPTAPTSPTPTTPTTAVSVDYTSGLDTPGGFNIGLTFSGTGWTDALKQGFQQSAEFLSDIITGDLPSVSTAAGVIDDIRISVSLVAIDGVGGLGGWGGYTAARSDSNLPYDGYVRMDSADAASLLSGGIWDDFALHEMLHALGFGTAWNAMGLVKDFGGDLRFIGSNAIQAYNDFYPVIAGADPLSDYGVPVEMDGGTGTAGVHWDDATFKNEIMTGSLNWSNIISDMTIAALQDMGYDTIYSDSLAFV